VRRLLPLIATGPHPDMPDDSPKQFGAEVAVILKDGRRLARRIDHLVCRGGDNPMSSEELFEKFEDCAVSFARPTTQGRAPVRSGWRPLETVTDLNQVTRPARAARACRAKAAERMAVAARGSAASGKHETNWVP